ncbi:MAG: hypothetical protein A2855_02670 [Candidatus Liptonbacteria bacterium RIFCSPHIGHO2_01_FULL_57_28]|uniref:Uncharacterized protein n=1 Tax=Candidatus Liptonbacteria bacterium RIFCSPHIGHO2_01_FULL_57_28 TaxID=1798647 RepID=A0A1G2CAJ7_9BACT|nr:MAG: hypothetical protein A2855_02670 [Candidatus Liptonbacteria bacterium RIFCSPHIGHO2_01_FULL_57_28]
MNDNRKIIYGSIVALVILSFAGGWYYNYAQNKTVVPDDQSAASSTDSNNSTTTSATSSKPTAAKPRLASDVTGTSMSYDQALEVFANQRIFFNENCRMVPTPIWVKNGIILMFDNPYREPRTFKLDGTPYTLPGYGFKLLQLRSTKLPHVVKVICGANQGTGEITLQ